MGTSGKEKVQIANGDSSMLNDEADYRFLSDINGVMPISPNGTHI